MATTVVHDDAYSHQFVAIADATHEGPASKRVVAGRHGTDERALPA